MILLPAYPMKRPWNILTKKNIKIAINKDNLEANVYLKEIKNFQIKIKIYYL